MFLEMVLAVIAFLTATVAFGGFAGLPGRRSSRVRAGRLCRGTGRFLEPHRRRRKTFGVAYGSVFLTIMGLTIMQLVVRFMRVASAELLGDECR